MGAPYQFLRAGCDEGAAYLFGESGGTWSPKLKLTAPGSGLKDLGTSVALSSSYALTGAPSINGQPTDFAYFYGIADLQLTLNTPTRVAPSSNFTSQVIVTNASSVASPAVAVTIAIPAAASFVSAAPSQGSCGESNGTIQCSLGEITSSGGAAAANVVLRASSKGGAGIENSAQVAYASPPLTVSTVTKVDNPPYAADSGITTGENKDVSSTLRATDADGDPLTFTIVASPTHGWATITGTATGKFTYAPNSGYSGSDSFTFKANDGLADSNTATVSITVKAPSSVGAPSSGGGAIAVLSLLFLAVAALAGRSFRALKEN